MLNTRETIYNKGNDYDQVLSAYFVTEATATAEQKGKTYSDGLYHFTTKPVYELSGGANALNKRIFNMEQSAWAEVPETIASAYSADPSRTKIYSDDYSVVDADLSDKTWEKPE